MLTASMVTINSFENHPLEFLSCHRRRIRTNARVEQSVTLTVRLHLAALHEHTHRV